MRSDDFGKVLGTASHRAATAGMQLVSSAFGVVAPSITEVWERAEDESGSPVSLSDALAPAGRFCIAATKSLRRLAISWADGRSAGSRARASPRYFAKTWAAACACGFVATD